jgi:hypothetical protein
MCIKVRLLTINNSIMKKLAILVITTMFTASMIDAQSQSPSENESKAPSREAGTAKAPIISTGNESVSFESQNSFDIDYPKVSDVAWEKTGSIDQVNFVSDGQKMSAYYDNDGNLIGTTTSKTLADLPEKAQKILSSKYADYTVGPVIFYHDNDKNDANMVLWATEFDSEDLYFAQLNKGSDKIAVEITPSGDVSYFTQIK